MRFILLLCLGFLTQTANAQVYSRATNNNVRYTDSTARVEIQSLYKMLRNGYDFEGLALRYSQDPGSYQRGGELGFSTLRDYVPEYQQAARALAVNEIAPPFKSDFGYHIVQLIAKKDSLYNTRHILLRVD